jgi:cell division protein FtsB
MIFDGPDHKGHPSPRSGSKHLNGQTNGYTNGHHLRIEQHPKHRADLGRPHYDHHDSYSSQGYSYARSTASSTESGPEYSPPTGSLSEPIKPYSPFYGSVSSPRDYSRGAHTPPYYPVHPHHSMPGPPSLALPPTSHVDPRSLPPPASLLRPSPPPRHDSPQLPPIYNMDPSRHHVAPHHPHNPLVPSKRDSPGDHHAFAEQLESLRQSNEQLRGRVMELELVNDLMKSRVSELESSEHKARSTIESLKSELSQYQTRENELHRKIDKLKDELVDTYKVHHSRSPSNSSRSGEIPEESASKRRKVLVSDLVDEKSQLTELPTSPKSSTSTIPNGTEVKSE